MNFGTLKNFIISVHFSKCRCSWKLQLGALTLSVPHDAPLAIPLPPRFQVPQSPGKTSQDNRSTGSGSKNTEPAERREGAVNFVLFLRIFYFVGNVSKATSPLQQSGFPLSFALRKVDAFVWFVSPSWPTPLPPSPIYHCPLPISHPLQP